MALDSLEPGLATSLTDRPQEPIRASELDPGSEWDKQSLRSQVHQVLGELEKQIPDNSHRILYMHWVEGRPMPEIAALLNLSVEQVWALHHRAKDKFRALFDRHAINARRPFENEETS